MIAFLYRGGLSLCVLSGHENWVTVEECMRNAKNAEATHKNDQDWNRFAEVEGEGLGLDLAALNRIMLIDGDIVFCCCN